MEIIGHTASLNKTIQALTHYLISNPCDKIEMDFALTKDNVLMWTHDMIVDGRFVTKSNYRDIKGLISLEEVLEVLDGNVDLLLEIKCLGTTINIGNLLKALEILKFHYGSTSIQSFNQNLVKLLLKYRSDLPCADIGLIINLFKTFRYRNGNINGLENLDFVSLASELWEWNKVGEDYKRYRELFPHALEYAWTWDSVYSENEIRIKNYMVKKADGIITREPAFVRSLKQKIN